MTAWKDLERRVCVALGGRRAGPIGAAVSDCVGVPFSVEVKRSSRPGPPVLSKWVEQARYQGRREAKPWLLVVAGHNDRRPIACMDFWELVELAEAAGRIALPTDSAGAGGVEGPCTNSPVLSRGVQTGGENGIYGAGGRTDSPGADTTTAVEGLPVSDD